MASAPTDTATTSKRLAMQRQRERDTAPELALRKELHHRGFRYRLHRSIVPGTRRTVDIVFGPARVAVDVRGCFWHGCPEHGTSPKKNGAWWQAKLAGNVARDRDTEARLEKDGWRVVVVWEHENPVAAADRVAAAVAGQKFKSEAANGVQDDHGRPDPGHSSKRSS